MISKTIGLFLAALCLLAYGCGDPGVSGAELSTRPTGAGGAETFPCETDDDCPRGEECEFEHGVSFCKPHGGDDRPADKPDPEAMECDSDYDCPRGEECEFEHGMSFCKPHGGDDDDDCERHDDDHHDGGDDHHDDHHDDRHDDCDDYCDDDYDDRSGSNSGKG